jgi:hypothetical protein
MTHDYLDDVEVVKIQTFCADEKMKEAVKKVLLFGLYNNGTLKKGKKADPLQNTAFGLFFAKKGQVSNEELGQDLRAVAEGINLIENAYNKLHTIKAPVTSDKPKVNIAR